MFARGEIERPEQVPASVFRDELLALAPQARARAMAALRASSWPALDFQHMGLGRNGDIYYADPPPEFVETESEGEVAGSGLTSTEVFTLHSRPGASKTLYLDFDGHTLEGTVWNNSYGASIVIPAWNVSGTAGTWDQAEIDRIAEAWKRVSEDFSSWDVDVTTEHPGYLANSRDSNNPRDFGPNVSHALITTGSNPISADCGCGGIAYINGWGSENLQTHFTFNSGLGSNAMTISHETGHALGLRHDGTSSSSYYGGHGSGATSWGPIMGAPFGKSVVTWSRADYPDAVINQSQPNDDDYAYIDNHLSYLSDDHEDVILADATPLVLTSLGDVISTTRVTDTTAADPANKGVIGTQADVDLFSMSLTDGTINLTVSADTRENFAGVNSGANLDVQLRLLDDLGGELYYDNPVDALHASISGFVVPGPGIYYLEISGVGRPATSDHPGYTDYGIIGQYTIHGTVPTAPVVIDPVAAPTNVTATVVNGNDVQIDWDDPNSGTASETGHSLYRSFDGGAFELLTTLPANNDAMGLYDDVDLPPGTYVYQVEAFNSISNEISLDSNVVVIDFVSVAVATSEQSALGGILNGSYLNTQQPSGGETLAEAHSGGRKSSRSSYLSHVWFVTGVVPAASVELEVAASVSASANEGFVFGYSLDNGASWNPLTNGIYLPGEGKVATASLSVAAPITVHVRVEDTDQTSRGRVPGEIDQISIQEIKVTSDGGMTNLPPTVLISSPQNNDVFNFDDAVLSPALFAATADDPEDLTLPGSAIDWTALPGGFLQSGGSFTWAPTAPGQYEITASATDGGGLSGSDTISIIFDGVAPTLTVPGPINMEATGALSTISLGAATATDDYDPSPVVGNDAPSVGFPLGTTVVTWTASDHAGHSTADSQSVTVSDTTHPWFTFVPGDITVDMTESSSVVLGTATADDLVDPDPTVSHDAPASFPMGLTVVTWTAVDGSGNSTSATQNVTVVDGLMPLSITSMTPNEVANGASAQDVVITGTGFAPGVTVNFANGSGPTPTASVQSVTDTMIIIDIVTKSGGPRRARTWDVVVTLDGVSVVLPDGLTITP